MSAEAQSTERMQDDTRWGLARLEADGLIAQSESTWKTSRRWQREMARAAAMLYQRGDPGDDLRVPIAYAMVGIYEDAIDDEALAQLVEAMLPIELLSLGLAPR